MQSWRTRIGAVLVAAAAVGTATGCVTPNAQERESEGKRARAHRDLGVDHLTQGRTELGLRELLAAEALDARDVWTQLWLGEAFRRKNRAEKAEAHLRRALELKPGFQEARLNLSALYIQLERYEEAAHHAAALYDDPTFPGPWRALTNLGWAQLQLGELEPARTHLTMAVEMNDRYWPAILDLAILEAGQGHRLEALRRFQQVLDANPPQTARDEVHFRMAEVYVSLGRRHRAMAHFEAAAAGNARARWAQESQRYLELLR